MFKFEVGKTYYKNNIVGIAYDAYQYSMPITITKKSAKSIWYSINNEPVRCSRINCGNDGEYFKCGNDYIFGCYLDTEPVEQGFLAKLS